MALPIEPRPTPTVVSELTATTSNDITITSIIPTDPLFPPRLRPQRPYHVREDIMEVGRGTRFITTTGSLVEWTTQESSS